MSDTLETLLDSSHLLELDPPEELVLSPSAVMPRRLVSGGVLSFVRPVYSLPVRTSRSRSVHRTQNSWLWSWSVSTWTTRRCWPAWKGVVAWSVDFDRIVHGLLFTGFLHRLRRSRSLASRLLSIGLGLSSPNLRQQIFAHETRPVLSTKGQSFVQPTLLAAKMVVVSPSEMRTPGKLGLIFS